METKFYQPRNYHSLKPNTQFRIRFSSLLSFEEWQEASLKHGICKTLSDGWAENQNGSRVSFTDNYPVWIQ